MLLDEKETESARIESRKTIDLTQFVSLYGIPVLYHEKPCLEVPGADLAEEALIALRAARQQRRPTPRFGVLMAHDGNDLMSPAYCCKCPPIWRSDKMGLEKSMEDTRSTLKTLVETTFDSVEGYRKAAETANSPQLKAVLTQQAQKRQSTLDALNQELVRVGGDRVTSGTTAGGLHRLWADITSMFEKGDEAAAERAEEGEDYLAKKFETALEERDLDPASRAVIEKASLEVREGERLTDQLASQYD